MPFAYVLQYARVVARLNTTGSRPDGRRQKVSGYSLSLLDKGLDFRYSRGTVEFPQREAPEIIFDIIRPTDGKRGALDSTAGLGYIQGAARSSFHQQEFGTMSKSKKLKVERAAAVALHNELASIYLGHDASVGTLGEAKFRAVVAWVDSHDDATIQAATDSKALGILPKSTGQVINAQTRAIRTCVRHVGADAVIGNTVGFHPGKGWTFYMEWVRDTVRDAKAERAEERAEEAAKEAAELQVRGDTPEAIAQRTAIVETIRANRRVAAEEAEAKAKQDAESVDGVASRIAKSLLSKFGEEFAHDVAHVLHDAIDAAVKAKEKAAA